MRKVDDQGASALRTIFSVILITAIVAGISSVHAENNDDNDKTGVITGKLIKYLTDHGNHKVVQVEGADIMKGSHVTSPDNSQGQILPRGFYDDNDDDDTEGLLSDGSDAEEIYVGGQYGTCPLCQSTSHEYTTYGGGGRGGSSCSRRGRFIPGGRSEHIYDEAKSDYSHYESDQSSGWDEMEGDERYAGNRRRGARGNSASWKEDSADLGFDYSHRIPGIDPGKYKNTRGNRDPRITKFGPGESKNTKRDRGGRKSYRSGRGRRTNGRRGSGYVGEGSSSGHDGYYDKEVVINSVPFSRGFADVHTPDFIETFFPSESYSPATVHPFSSSARRRMVLDSSNRNGYMLPNDVIDTVQDLIDDPSMFYVTFACQPKVGKYLCKIQCVKRNEEMTGSCDSGYCHCILRTEKKDRKRVNKRFLAAMEGFKTNCATKAKSCKRYCKDLTPDKSFTGHCSNDKCKCVTFPSSPDSKKNACTKAIQKLRKIEDQALRCLGLPVIRAGSWANEKLSAATNDFMNKLHDSKTVEGCTPEDIENLRGIISNLAQGLNYAKTSGVKIPTLSSLANSQETLGTPTRSQGPKEFTPLPDFSASKE